MVRPKSHGLILASGFGDQATEFLGIGTLRLPT